MQNVHLRSNHQISRVIRGGWQLAGDHGSVDRAMAVRDMEAFFDAGITTFDCADIYTGVEEMIGDFIANIRRERGAAIAGEICVHTKLVPDLSRLADVSSEEIEAIIDRSLRRLKIDQLHLVQFFWWDLNIGSPVAAFECLKRMQEKGKIRNLGSTNWDVAQIEPFVAAGFDIVSMQVQYSLLDRRPAGDGASGLAQWGAQNNVQLLCYGTLAGGFLTADWLGKPDPGFAFENRSLVKYRLIIDEFGSWELFQELLTTLQHIGDKHGVALSAVASRFVLNQPQAAAVIIGARYARNLPSTLQIFAFDFDDQDIARINAVLAKSSGPAGPVYGLERDKAGRHGSIMKYNLNSSPDEGIYAEEKQHA